MFGWTGKSLKVDLTSQRVEACSTRTELVEEFLGGRGFGVRLVSERCSLDPFDPGMALVIATGPLTNSMLPTSGRWSVVSQSPLTGTIFDASCGGSFGHHLKGAGYDYLLVEGKSTKPVYLKITSSAATLEDASHLWGKTTSETTRLLRDQGSVATVGPAGEKRVLFANIVSDYTFCAGRGGLGAVMASKGLKAIVVKGDRKLPVADPGKVKTANQDILRLLKASPAIWGAFGLREFGTAALVDLLHMRRMMPTNNFRETFFSESHRFSGYTLTDTYKSRKHACHSCPIACKKTGEDGTSMPEFETVSHFGALNGNDDLDAIVKANTLCNEYGMDTISVAATISAYAEVAGERFGPARLLELVRLTGDREGIGDQLAEGSSRFAAFRGAPGASMSCKSLEFPAYDPRGAYGMALAYATSNRGGCHLRAYPISHEILRKPVVTDRFSFEGKARVIKISEDINAAIDSMIACKFAFFGASLEEYALALSGVTGRHYDAQSLQKIGERICLLERSVNSKLGFSRKDDDLPGRFFTDEGSSTEKLKILPLNRKDFEDCLSRYYRIRGCDAGGVPTEEKLLELGINVAADQ